MDLFVLSHEMIIIKIYDSFVYVYYAIHLEILIASYSPSQCLPFYMSDYNMFEL